MAKGTRPVAGGGGSTRAAGGGANGERRDDPAHAVKVEMSARAEERVRRALVGVSLDAVVAAALPELTETKLRRAYDGLLARGFAASDVEDALTFVASVPTDPDAAADKAGAGADAVEVEALDWLCFTLPTEKLPRRYQGSARSAAAAPGSAAAAVEVVRRADADAAWEEGSEAEDDEAAAAAAEDAARAAAEAAAAAEARARADAARRRAEVEQAARANREWIMRQYDGSDSASDADASGGSDHDSLEDFGLPPEEIERRAVARRRKRAFDTDPGAHIAVMRAERDAARADAAAAKAARDKPKQRAAGDALKKIADELNLYGLTQEDLDPPLLTEEEEHEIGLVFAHGGDVETNERGMETGEAEAEARLDPETSANPPPSPPSGSAVSAASAPEADAATDSDDDISFGVNLFDEDEDTEALMGAAREPDALDTFRLLVAPLFPPSRATKSDGKKGAAARQPSVPAQPPKALLQMLCRHEGWIAPRYEKVVEVTPGSKPGAKASVGAVSRGAAYAAVVERNPRDGARKRVGGGAAARAAAFSTVTARWPEHDVPPEGWPSVSDAQNAAACRALFDVLASAASAGARSGRGLPADPSGRNVSSGDEANGAGVAFAPEELDATFLAAWRRWAEDAHRAEVAACAGEGGAGGARQSGPDARDAFAAALMAERRRRGEEASAGRKNRRAATMRDEARDDADSWERRSWDATEGPRRADVGTNATKTGHGARDAANGDDANGEKLLARSEAVDARLLGDAAARREDEKWRAMWSFRRNLPVFALRDALLRALRDGDSDAAVVCGETGSGKTTQVPQYLLDDAIERGEGSSCRVVCTQPRRVAALTVAERVCAERCEARGVGGAGSLVGHHVRLDAKVTKDTRLTFMTAGILLRKMHGDPLLRDVSHVVLDEIHERSLDGDFLLALLRDVPRRRRALNMRPLKLVVMSATLDAELFCGYLGNCAAVSAPGRTHPVTTVHLERIHDMLEYSLDEDSRCCRRPAGARRGEEALSRMSERDRSAAMDAWGADGDSVWRGDENPDFDPGYYAGLPDPISARVTRNLSRLDESVVDYDCVEKLLVFADEDEPRDGAFLVFLPGIGEVTRLIERLHAHPRFAPRHGAHKICALHSALTPAEQREAFRVPGGDVRKIVVATNVAETSVTIPDVVVVVDSGRVKERQWDPRRGMASLEEGWVSRASARQRAGRAGRVRPGKCYAMFTSLRASKQMRSHQVPELHRVPLTEVVLQIKKLGVGGVPDPGSRTGRGVGSGEETSAGSGDAAAFLAGALEPPAPAAVAAAIATLREIGALEREPRRDTNHSRKPMPKTDAVEIENAPTPHVRGDTDGGGSLTPLGHHLALLPVDCRVAKMLVYGALLSCVSPTLTVAACLSYKSPFLVSAPGYGPAESESARHALAKPGAGGLAAGEQSDHLTYAEAYKRWAAAACEAERGGGAAAARDAARRHARKHGLSLETLRQIAEMRGQYAALLRDAGFLEESYSCSREGADEFFTKKKVDARPRGWADDPRAPWNAEANNAPVAKAVLAAGLYANVAALEDDAQTGRADKTLNQNQNKTALARWRDAKGALGVHASSVNAKLASASASAGAARAAPRFPFLTFHEKVKTHRVFARDSTVVAPAALLLFGGDVEVKHETGRVCLDGWLWLRASAQTAALFRRARAALDAALAARVARAGPARANEREKERDPDPRGNEVVLAIRALLNDKTV